MMDSDRQEWNENKQSQMTVSTQFESEYRAKQNSSRGQMIVLYQRGSFLVTLGPHYYLFLSMLLILTFSAIFLVFLVNTSLDNKFFKALNIFIATLECLSYLLLGLSNPGIVTEHTMIQQAEKATFPSAQHRYCKICQITMRNYQRHCKICEVCIMGYDHHCPYTSKCVGQGNLKLFYLFVVLTPFYIVYFIVTILVCMVGKASQ